MRSTVVALLAVAMFLGGCASERRYLPLATVSANIPVPAQQMMIVEALDKAFDQLDFSPLVHLEGATVVIDVAGCLLDPAIEGLARARLETRLLQTRPGVKLLTPLRKIGRAPAGIDKGEAGSWTVVAHQGVEPVTRQYPTDPAPTYRIVLFLDAAGADDETSADSRSLVGKVDARVAVLPLLQGGEASFLPPPDEGKNWIYHEVLKTGTFADVQVEEYYGYVGSSTPRVYSAKKKDGAADTGYFTQGYAPVIYGTGGQTAETEADSVPKK